MTLGALTEIIGDENCCGEIIILIGEGDFYILSPIFVKKIEKHLPKT